MKRVRWALSQGLVVVWLLAVIAGLVAMARYKGAPGAAGDPPALWPQSSALVFPENGAALLMLIHPKCPCTRASVDELAKLMTDLHGKLTAYVLVVEPEGVPSDWSRTDLPARAAEISGVHVIADRGGHEAARFGAATSGETIVYGADHRLFFHGGITVARGHAGDSAGERRISQGLSGAAERADAPVFGCPLHEATGAAL